MASELDNLPDHEIPCHVTMAETRDINRKLVREIIRYKLLSRSKRRVVNGRARLWYRHFTNSECPETFLKANASARAAGYKCKTDCGFQSVAKFLKTLFNEDIDDFLDREGLSETALKGKLAVLLDAKETKFFADKGKVTDTREVDALGIQMKAVETGMKLRKMLTDKTEVTVSKETIADLINALPAGVGEAVRRQLAERLSGKRNS